MAELEKQVRRVLRRLNIQMFVHIQVWCWVVSLGLAVFWVLAEKFWEPVIEPWWWTVVASLSLGSLAAIVVWLFTRRRSVDAAIELDHAFDLKERASSTLTLPEELRQTAAGIALVADTTNRINQLDVRTKFPIRVPRTAWLPLVPGVLVFLVASVLGPLGGSEPAQAKTDISKEERQQIEQSTKGLAKRLERRKEMAKEQGLKEMENLLAELSEKAKQEIGQSEDIDRRKALAKLHDLQDALKERRENLGTADQLKQRLAKMESAALKGPAEKFAEALKQGDFKKAIDALTQLSEQLASGKLDPEKRKELEKQLAQLKKQLQQLADLKERRRQLQQAGLPPDVLARELAKLDLQAKQLQMLDKLAEKLGNCQQCLAEGQTGKALEALEMSKAELQQLMQDLRELEMLEMALSDLAEMKNAMVCQSCGGFGCAVCQGIPGMGMGRGRGQGDRPEQEEDTRGFKTRTPLKWRRGGKIEVGGFVHGLQSKGESQLEMQQLLETGQAEATQALSKQRIPREYSKQAKQYFKEVRKTTP